MTRITDPDFHFHIVLFEPEIPPNTGNAGRLCVATKSTLHLVGKLGFDIDDKQVRRAGLDYWKFVDLKTHKTFEDWLSWYRTNEPNAPFYLVETGVATSLYKKSIPPRAAFVFGKETTGIPRNIIEANNQHVIDIPMFSDKIRSLNLANTVGIVLFEAIRQQLQ